MVPTSGEYWRVTLKQDEGKTSPPVYYLQPLDTLGRVIIQGSALNNNNQIACYEAVMFSLRGGENLADKNGKPLTVKTEMRQISSIGKREVVTEETMNLLDEKVIYLIANEVFGLNFLDESQRKN